jgi:hypothetical protein
MVERLLPELDGFRHSFDAALETLAHELPRLAEELANTARVAEAVTSNQDAGPVQTLVDATRSLERDAARASNWLLTAQSDVSRAVGELGPLVTTLMEALGDVRLHAQRMKFVALNASIIALRLGSKMAGFTVATRELIDLATAELVAADQVMESITLVRELFTRLERARHELEGRARASRERHVETALEETLGDFDELRRALARVTTDARTLGERVHTSMVAAQRQDILRQGLEHIALVLRELELAERKLVGSLGELAPNERVETALFVERGYRLSRELLSGVGTEIRELIEELADQVRDIESIGAAVASMLGRAASNSGLLERLQRVFHDLVGLETELAQAIGLNGDNRQAVQELDAVMRPLATRLRTFEERREQLRTLNMLLKLQDAHQQGMGGTRAILETLDELEHRRTGGASDLSQSAEDIRGALRQLRAMGGIRGRAPETSVLRDHFAAFERAASRAVVELRDNLEGGRRAGEHVGGAATALLELLARLRADLDRVEAMLETFERRAEAASEVQAEARRAGGREPENSARLAELAQRFTILAHKRAAWHHEGSQGGASGDATSTLTLF